MHNVIYSVGVDWFILVQLVFGSTGCWSIWCVRAGTLNQTHWQQLLCVMCVAYTGKIQLSGTQIVWPASARVKACTSKWFNGFGRASFAQCGGSLASVASWNICWWDTGGRGLKMAVEEGFQTELRNGREMEMSGEVGKEKGGNGCICVSLEHVYS